MCGFSSPWYHRLRGQFNRTLKLRGSPGWLRTLFASRDDFNDLTIIAVNVSNTITCSHSTDYKRLTYHFSESIYLCLDLDAQTCVLDTSNFTIRKVLLPIIAQLPLYRAIRDVHFRLFLMHLDDLSSEGRVLENPFDYHNPSICGLHCYNGGEDYDEESVAWNR
jgi:hypothetical protein